MDGLVSEHTSKGLAFNDNISLKETLIKVRTATKRHIMTAKRHNNTSKRHSNNRETQNN